MRLDDIFASVDRPTISCEFFPPKSERGEFTLSDTIQQLAPMGLDFTSVTYGAGGSTQSATGEIVSTIQDKHNIPSMAHFTCVNATNDSVRASLDDFYERGIRNILALRGDPPKGQERFIPTEGGPAHSTDLIEMVRDDGRFAIVGSAYPDGHPQSPSREADWDRLVQKFELGITAAITQCFFNVEDYVTMVEYVQKRVPGARILPGILPIVNYKSVEKFCTMCGAVLSDNLRDEVGPYADDPIAVRQAGMQFTINFCKDLIKAGAPGLHLYTLNKSTACAEIITALRYNNVI